LPIENKAAIRIYGSRPEHDVIYGILLKVVLMPKMKWIISMAMKRIVRVLVMYLHIFGAYYLVLLIEKDMLA